MPTISSLGVGSGMDLSGLLDQLAKAEQQKLVPLDQQKQSYQAKLSAFGKLQGALSSFQVAAKKLDNDAIFDSVKSSVTGTGLVAAANSEATPGSYQINVTQLARAYSVATQGVADRKADLGAGTVNLKQANGETLSVTLEAGSSSLEDLRDAINDQRGGITASIINDGSGTPYRLVLNATNTGTESTITEIDFGTLLTVDGATEVDALNAELTINNIAISSQSNRVEEALEGVTMDLSATGEVTLKVESDTGAMRDAIKGFVTAYNSLRSSMASLGKYDAGTGVAGELQGDSALRSVQTNLRQTISSGVEEGEFHLLSDIGITLQLDGTLKLDEKKLDSLLATKRDALREFFAGGDSDAGLADAIDGLADKLLGTKGVIQTATKGLDASIERVEDNRLRMTKSIDATIARYRAQFSQLDSLVAGMNSQSGYLTQQFSIMNAQMNQK